MTTVAELLRRYIEAMTDPTRGAILMELAHAKELTPTQIARRLEMTANNVYHHMRVLRQMDVVDPPRVVPRETYVEKYYRINADLVAAVNSDPEWLDKAQTTLTAADHKALFSGMCMTMAQQLMRAARRYQAMDDDAFERRFFAPQWVMASINTMDRDKLMRRLASLRALLAQEQRDDAEANAANGVDVNDFTGQNNLVLMAGLPLMWDDEVTGGEQA